MLCRAALNQNKIEFLVQDEWNGKWEKPIMYYDVIGICRSMNEKQMKRALNSAMTTWEVEIPINFHPSWVDDITPDITIDFKNKTNDKLFLDSPSVLAYAYFPNQGVVSGKLVFNDDYLWDFLGKGIKASDALKKGLIVGTNNPDNIIKTYSLIAVLIHELGHMLGLTHDASGNNEGLDVMDAYYSGVDRLNLSERDMFRIKGKYGSRIYKFWSRYGDLKRALKKSILRL